VTTVSFEHIPSTIVSIPSSLRLSVTVLFSIHLHHFLYLFLCHDSEDPGLSVVLHPGGCIDRSYLVGVIFQYKHLFPTGHGFGCFRMSDAWMLLKAVVGRRGVLGVGFMC
jgi:hypothetical protein